MKSYIAFVFTVLLVGASFAQEQIQSQLNSVESDPLGWAQQNSGTTGLLRAVCFKSKDTGWIATGTNFILRTTNAGNSWFQSPTPSRVCDISTINDKTGVYAACDGYNFFYTSNGGDTWTHSKVDTSFPLEGILSLSFPSARYGYALATNYTILSSSDAGATWKSSQINLGGLDFTTFYAMNYVDSLNGLIVGDSTILRMGGTGYIKQRDTSFRRAHFFSCQLVTKNIEFAVGNDVIIGDVPKPAIIVRSTDGGISWKKTTIEPEKSGGFLGISFIDSIYGTVVGYGGIIYRTNDGGNSWFKQESGVVTELKAVSFSDSITGTIVGDGGIILRTINGGYSWVRQYLPFDSIIVQSFPEPASSSVSIHYTIPSPQHVTITLYDLTGKVVRAIIQNNFQSQGEHTIPVDLRNLPSGNLFFRLETEKYQVTGKITRIAP